MPSRLPLVGRAGLVARATELLDHAGGGIVLVGESGVGKSRVAAEILRLGAERGYATASTVGTQAAADIPLGALSHLLPDLEATGGNVLAAARASLVRLAGDRRLLLAVDDAHLLDPHSAALVLQLALGVPSFVVATIRSGEPVPDAIVALWKEGVAERVEVGRLDDAAIAEMVPGVLDGPTHPDLVASIVARAGGSPLVARELCLAALDSGGLVRPDGRWQLRGALPPSARLSELVEARVEGLGPGERRAIELVALAEPLAVADATAISGSEPLIEVERRGLVVVRHDGRRRELWLSHPYYADVLRARAGALLTTTLRGTLADAVRAHGMRRRSDLIRVATWLLEAGRPEPDLLLAAARETYRALDMAGTARLASGAWDASRSVGAGLLLATGLSYMGRHEEADAILAATAGLATDDEQRTRVAVAHSTVLSVGLWLPEEARAVVAAAERLVSEPAALRVLRAQRAHLLAYEGDVDAPLDLAGPILAVDEGVARVVAALACLIVHTGDGAYDAATTIFEATRLVHRRLWDAGATTLAPEILELVAAQARVAAGHLQSLPAAPERRGGPVAEGAGGRPVAVLRAVNAAMAAVLRGRPREAERLIADPAPDRTDRLIVAALAIRAQCAALTGRVADAERELGQAEAAARTIRMTYNRVLDEARVWTLVAGGRPRHAREAAIDAVERSIATHRWGVALAMSHDLARIGGVAEAAVLVSRIDGPVDGPLAMARRRHLQGLASGDANALEDAATAFAGIGAGLLAAEAAADAGRALRRAGDPRRAARSFRRAAALAAGCEGARTPALVMPDELTPLSRREREIAALAANGLSSEEIANRLVLSVRTVDNHLGHVYQKLGIATRGELPAALDGEDGSAGATRRHRAPQGGNLAGGQ